MPDWSKFLDTPWFAIDHMAIFSDIREFLEFSEANIASQKAIAITRVQEDEPEFEDEADAHAFRKHEGNVPVDVEIGGEALPTLSR